MAPYIFGKRNTIHIIDIRETVKGLLRARKYISQVVAGGKAILFVGTKRQAKHQIQEQATRVNMPFVCERWLGGTLTNFRTIRSRLTRLDELEAAIEAAVADGTAMEYSKKMIASRTRELRKIKRNLEGIRSMTTLPGAVVVIDVQRERNAVCEAKKLGIPTICLIDTDSDPDYADLPIPGNDDAMRGIEAILTHLADAVEEGLRGRATREAEEAEAVKVAQAKRKSEREAAALAEEAAKAATIAGEVDAGADVVSSANEGLAPATATDPEPTPQ